ncbi:sensor histidine kinase [Aquipuribacter nitratireducens]|uniref:histidine kinase n=1 Tax=Aquipuribacter nitratireducens TaxID=650104 RepID=A0ABW0GMM6_9MICO
MSERSAPAAQPPGSGISLELRLVVVVVLAVTVAITVLGATLVAAQRQQLVDQVNTQLQRAAPAVADIAARNLRGQQLTEGRTVSVAPDLPSEYVVVVHVEAFDSTVEIPAQVRSRDDMPAIPPLSAADARAQGTRPFTVSSRDSDLRWQVVTLPAADGSASVSVALPLEADDTTKRLVVWTLVTGSLVVATAALLGGVAVRRSLRPLTAVEHTAAAIAAGDLTRRVPEGGQDTEVGRLTQALNGMLARIEDGVRQRDASQARMRRFVADASHELRTPLASIRGFAELHRQGAVPEEEVPGTFARIEDEARRLGVLVEDLLLLARLDEQRAMKEVPVDLVPLAVDATGDVRALDPARQVRVLSPDGSPVTATTVVGDPDRLRQVLTNLVGNAVRHTPAGSPVEVVVGPVPRSDGREVALAVRDHGLGVPDEAKGRVFDRFSRLDASRTRGTGGTGLGLSIVAAIVAAHGGTVEVRDTPGGGATFEVRLPAAPRESREPADPEDPDGPDATAAQTSS